MLTSGTVASVIIRLFLLEHCILFLECMQVGTLGMNSVDSWGTSVLILCPIKSSAELRLHYERGVAR